jgi:hypothetical protein
LVTTRPRTMVHLALSLWACLAVGLAAQHEACPECQGLRKMEIKRDSSWVRAAKFQEEHGIWCNWCQGLGVYDRTKRVAPCLNCGGFPNPAESDSDVSSYQRDALETQLDYWWKNHGCHRVVFITTPNMTLSCGLEPIELSKTHLRNYYPERKRVAETMPGVDPRRMRILSRHERAHMFILRMIDAYEFCNRTVGVKTEEQENYFKITVPRIDAFIFGSKMEQDSFVAKHGGHGRYRGVQIQTDFGGGGTANDDDRLHSSVIHNIAHHWCDRAFGGSRKREPPGWLYAGIAHHLEMVTFGEPINKCDYEYNKGMQWSGNRWRTKLFKEVKDQEVQLQEVLTKTKEAQSFMEHRVAWSLVDYLSWFDRENRTNRFAVLMAELIKEHTLAEALRESHGWTTNMLEINWIRYVQQYYRLEPKKPKPR